MFSTFHRNTKKPKQPYIIFNDKRQREVWLKMIQEMRIGLLLAKSEESVLFLFIVN